MVSTVGKQKPKESDKLWRYTREVSAVWPKVKVVLASMNMGQHERKHLNTFVTCDDVTI